MSYFRVEFTEDGEIFISEIYPLSLPELILISAILCTLACFIIFFCYSCYYESTNSTYRDYVFWCECFMIEPKPFKAKNTLCLNIEGKWPNYIVTSWIKNTNTTLGIKRYLQDHF